MIYIYCTIRRRNKAQHNLKTMYNNKYNAIIRGAHAGACLLILSIFALKYSFLNVKIWRLTRITRIRDNRLPREYSYYIVAIAHTKIDEN